MMPKSSSNAASVVRLKTPAEHSARLDKKAALRANIARLQQELEARSNDVRPMPSSVMRAYQALIDKEYEKLDQLS